MKQIAATLQPLFVVWLLAFAAINHLQAGGSGLNTIVVVNQNSPDSYALGNYFCERRSVPPENLLRISWAGGNGAWSSSEFTTNLLEPLLALLTERQLSNQVEYVVLSMDLPFQTILNVTNINSTTSALFYGLKTNSASDPTATNSYAASEMAFTDARPASAPGASFLTTMITGDSLSAAKHMVDQGVASDGTFPVQPVILAKTTDFARNIRQSLFDNAIFNANILGVSTLIRTNSNSPAGQTNLLGYETGLAQFTVAPETFVPGAIADSLTSFGGIIFGANDQTSLLAFLKAGATGSYGTVAEPYSDTQKFPNPLVYFYQARGFSLAESYYQSVTTPNLGLTVAEPLAAPFARSGSGHWVMGISNSVLTGSPAMQVQFSARDESRPLQQIDLFVDGKFFRTLTNLPPAPGNILTATLNGYPVTYTVPINASLSGIMNSLAAQLNDPVVTSSTKIKALARGDRLELQSINNSLASFQFYATTNPAGLVYRTAYLPETFPPRLIPTGLDKQGRYQMRVEIPTALNYTIQASTNLTDWQPIFTNTIPGLLDFHDGETALYPRRFYRVAGPVPNQLPKISATGLTNNNAFQLQIESQPGQPCAIVVSTNQLDWSGMITNQSGGMLDFTDASATNSSSRFYRAWLPPPKMPTLTETNSAAQSPLLRIDNALQPYTVECSTNGNSWLALRTNFAIREIQATTDSVPSTNDLLGTFLRVSRPQFLNSEAVGTQEYKVLASTLAVGNFLQLNITKTNGQLVVISITNQTVGLNSTNIVGQLFAAINNHAALQGPDGILAEDLSFNSSFSTFFLRARRSGYSASRIRVAPKQSGVFILPASPGYLQNNLADLQPRNHLYVTAGASELTTTFSLDSTQFPDGYHELTAVAYEGSSVRTQTRTSVPVRIQNTSLTATLTLLDLTNNAPVAATYQVQVSANTNNVSLTTLFSTGGPIGFATNNPSATFAVIGTNLWVGLHPFYAIVETATGEKYRTETRWIRLQ